MSQEMNGFERLRNELEQEQLEKNMQEIRKIIPFLFDFHIEASKAIFNYYTQLQKAGFKPNEALMIVINHGMVPKINGLGGKQE